MALCTGHGIQNNTNRIHLPLLLALWDTDSGSFDLTYGQPHTGPIVDDFTSTLVSILSRIA
jgi:hypothetical protein